MKRVVIGFVLFFGACASVTLSPVATHDAGDAAVELPDLASSPDASHPDLQMPCTVDTDCAGSSLGSFCNTASGVCVTCVSRADDCAKGRYCADATHTCELGCKASSDCAGTGAALACDTTAHQCVGCVLDGDCQPGTVCSAQKACVPGCNAAQACDAGRSCCTGSCFDLQGDPTHCGACGNVCDTAHSTGAGCAAGSCTYTGCVDTFADCTTTAPDTDGCETSATTTSHCGMCGACATGGVVTSAACVVPQTGNASCAYSCACSTTADSIAASCDGQRCSYTCAAGRADCNGTVGTDQDGCECPTAASSAQGTAGCCPQGCQTTHTDGFSDSFFDCGPAGTYNVTEAFAAAAAAVGIAGTASDGWHCGSGSNIGSGVCKQSATTCACWIYSSTGTIAAAGHARYNMTSNGCFCAGSTDPAWN
ncbi:MAG: hypothetical protein ABI321_16020 [Polyangia bacterium]